MLWPYPFIPFANAGEKNYLNSPVPILASFFEEHSGAFCSKWKSSKKNRIHVNLDEGVVVGDMLEVYLPKLLATHSVLDKLSKVQDQLRQELAVRQEQRKLQDRNNLLLVLSLQALHILRNAISVIYLKDFDKKLLEGYTVDVEQVKEAILGKSKLDREEHKRLLDSQIFQYFFENICQLKSELETQLF